MRGFPSALVRSATVRLPNPQQAGLWLGWILVIWTVVFFRLGYASLWDPDEGFYASASMEMRAAGDWFAPRYNDAPFFDKPILFYLLQMGAFALLGETEFAVRIVPAISAIVLIGATAWLGSQLFDRRTGLLGALILALLPATFALSAYAILDMTFVAFLFTGSALLAVAALCGRPRLQYGGYVLIGLAVLTKGPLALALAGLAFVGSLIVAPTARKPLLGLAWVRGLAIVLAISAPWFIYMVWRFDGAFVEGYFLRENIWLYARPPVVVPTSSPFFFLRLTAVALLPWTPLLFGRLIDIARGCQVNTEERTLWVWAGAVIAFFSFSQFRLDHYVYPAAPALCLLAAREWTRARDANRWSSEWGARVGAVSVPLVVTSAGVALAILIARVPLDLSPTVAVVPIAFIASGVALFIQLARRRSSMAFPVTVIGAMLLGYVAVLMFALPQLEQAKPVKLLARELAARAVETDSVAAYRMDRWNPSWRFYLRRHIRTMESPDELHAFFEEPGRRFCLMLREDYQALAAQGMPVWIVLERPGLLLTSGRALRRDRRSAWRSFVVVSNEPPSAATGTTP